MINEDNEACINLANNPQVSPKAKHIDIRFHFLRRHIDESIILQSIPSKENPADSLTKPLTPATFVKHKKSIG